MAVVNFFSSNISTPTTLNRVANIGFLPVRYLFGGRYVQVMQGSVHLEHALPLQPVEKDYRKTLIMIALIVPGLFVGTLARLFSLYSADVRTGISYSHAVKPYTWIKPEETDERQLMALEARNNAAFERLFQHVRGADIWDNPQFIADYDGLLESSFLQLQHHFANAIKESQEVHPQLRTKKLAAILCEKRCQMIERDNYLPAFYANSFDQLYHIARNHMWKADGEWKAPALFTFDQASFFRLREYQYKWREMFNQIHPHLQELGLLDENSFNYNSIQERWIFRDFKKFTRPDLAPFRATAMPGWDTGLTKQRWE